MSYKWKFTNDSNNNIIIASDGVSFKNALLEASKHIDGHQSIDNNAIFSFCLARVQIPPDVSLQGKPPISIRIYKNPVTGSCTWTLSAYDNPKNYKNIYNSYVLKCETNFKSLEDPEKSLLTFFKFLKLESFY